MQSAVSPTPSALARGLSALIDVLIPGDDLFPAASLAGATGLVFERLRWLEDEQFVEGLLAYLEQAADGRDFASLPAEEQRRLVAQLERERPAWFEQLRFVTYLSYYQLPPVVRAVRALGFEYNEAPQPRGYSMDPFDPAQDLPQEPRGSYVPTDAVQRVDLSGLGDLTRPVDY
jgi:hypothetical protein